MTVQSTISRADYVGNGVTKTFSVPFYFLDDSHLKVIVAGSTMALGSDYTVTGSGVASGGSVTLTTAPASGAAVAILRSVPNTQLTHYVPNDPFPAASHETALDKATMQVQQLSERVDRSLELPDYAAGVSTTLPTPAANQILAWNENANGLQNLDAAGLATVVAFGTAKADIFTGDGVTLAFTLSANPGAQANLDVAIGGVTQLPGVDFSWSGGTSVTFTTAPPNGAKVLIRYMRGLPQGVADSAATTFTQAGSGAVIRTAQDKMREHVSVTDFGAKGDGATDDSASIRLAINSGKSVLFPEGTYLCNNLIGSSNFQRLYAEGRVVLQKNASGPLLTVNANYVECCGIVIKDLSSGAFTGDGFQFNGHDNRLINCGCTGVQRRAVLSSGQITIVGGTDVYQTWDTSAGAYDIEIGNTTTATLYSQLIGVRTGWANGGIKLLNNGSQAIVGGQFGKLYIQNYGSPSGVNGGTVSGARIVGNVTVESSSALFTGNQFDAVSIVLAASTSHCSFDLSNSMQTATITNNGNANNLILREISSGGTSQIKIGADASVAVETIDQSTGQRTSSGGYNVASGKTYAVNGIQVVKARVTGWAQWSGTANRSTKNTASATVTDVAQTLAALIDDLFAHGLIGN